MHVEISHCNLALSGFSCIANYSFPRCSAHDTQTLTLGHSSYLRKTALFAHSARTALCFFRCPRAPGPPPLRPHGVTCAVWDMAYFGSIGFGSYQSGVLEHRLILSLMTFVFSYYFTFPSEYFAIC